MRYVYVIRNLINGKVYVGQTKNFAQRKAGHIYSAKSAIDRPLQRSMRKHGIENFSFEIIEECVDVQINEREQFWVAHFDSFNPEKGYNLTSGGDAPLFVSDETRKKMSESQTGHIVSDETKKKIRKARLGWEGLRGPKNPNFGKPLAQSVRDQLSAYAKQRIGDKNPNAKLTPEIVKQIKLRLQNGARVCDVVKEFDISRSQVNRVKNDQQWSHITIDSHEH